MMFLVALVGCRVAPALFIDGKFTRDLRDGAWRARGGISRLRHGVDRVRPLNRDAADVWSLRLPRARRVPTV